MSLRPRAGNPVRRDGDVRRRLWSESPIPRHTRRRIRTTKGGDLATMSVYWTATVGSSATSITASTSGTVSGDLLVCMLASRGYTIADPSGSWTNIATGTVTNLTYRVSYIVSTGSTTATFGLSGAGSGAAIYLFALQDYGSRVPAAGDAREYTATSSVRFPRVNPVCMSPWQMLAFTPTTTGAFTTASDPAWIEADSLGEVPVANTLQLSVMHPRDTSWLSAFPGPADPASRLITDTPGEWVTLPLGLE